MAEKNYFEVLNSINVNDKIEKKNGLSYLSWAYAWGELKKKHPDSFYTVYENADGWNYHTDGRTAWVKTGVTVMINDSFGNVKIPVEHIEYLPVMDYRNQSIPLEKITSFDVNKAIQRSLTKAVARHGLGLYIYAGEDLPIDDGEAKMNESLAKKITKADADKMTKILSDAQKEWVLKTYHVAKLTDLTNEQYGLIMRTINERLSKDEG